MDIRDLIERIFVIMRTWFSREPEKYCETQEAELLPEYIHQPLKGYELWNVHLKYEGVSYAQAKEDCRGVNQVFANTQLSYVVVEPVMHGGDITVKVVDQPKVNGRSVSGYALISKRTVVVKKSHVLAGTSTTSGMLVAHEVGHILGGRHDLADCLPGQNPSNPGWNSRLTIMGQGEGLCKNAAFIRRFSPRNWNRIKYQVPVICHSRKIQLAVIE